MVQSPVSADSLSSGAEAALLTDAPGDEDVASISSSLEQILLTNDSFTSNILPLVSPATPPHPHSPGPPRFMVTPVIRLFSESLRPSQVNSWLDLIGQRQEDWPVFRVVEVSTSVAHWARTGEIVRHTGGLINPPSTPEPIPIPVPVEVANPPQPSPPLEYVEPVVHIIPPVDMATPPPPSVPAPPPPIPSVNSLFGDDVNSVSSGELISETTSVTVGADTGFNVMDDLFVSDSDSDPDYQPPQPQAEVRDELVSHIVDAILNIEDSYPNLARKINAPQAYSATNFVISYPTSFFRFRCTK